MDEFYGMEANGWTNLSDSYIVRDCLGIFTGSVAAVPAFSDINLRSRRKVLFAIAPVALRASSRLNYEWTFYDLWVRRSLD